MKGTLKHTKKGWGISYTDTKTKEKKFIKLHPNDLEQLLKQPNPSGEDGKKVEFEIGHTEEHGKFPRQIKFTNLSESDLNKIVKRVIKEQEEEIHKWDTSPKKDKFQMYSSEIDKHMTSMEIAFGGLLDMKGQIIDDESLSVEQKDDLTDWIDGTLDDLYSAFMTD